MRLPASVTLLSVAATVRHRFGALDLAEGWIGVPSFSRGWTVSDGTFVVEASLNVDTEDAFRKCVEDCDRMMRSVRFEGAS